MATGNLNLVLAPTTPREHEEFKKSLRDAGERLEPVSSIGDDAFLVGERINVRVGNNVFAIWFGDPQGASPQRKEKVLALARAGVAKLR